MNVLCSLTQMAWQVSTTTGAVADFPTLNVNARDQNDAVVARNLKYQ
jgi:hypothetical protein